ncbi:aldo/keto reductase, partial [Aquicoccus sp. SCR17]|nr:aldo/keto reductase [Carideicomes alvinocaridis]
MTSVPTVPFHDGQQIPQLGLGVWQVEDDVAADVVEQAIRAGYRHIDTAAIYGNEEGVGRGIAASGVAREELFLTTKVWNSDQGYEEALAALDVSLDKLGTDYVDLYLIHWAKPAQGKYVDTWKALIEAQKQGKV